VSFCIHVLPLLKAPTAVDLESAAFTNTSVTVAYVISLVLSQAMADRPRDGVFQSLLQEAEVEH